MIIKRTLEEKLKALAAQFAAVSVTGPRQSGKTTLAKKLFPTMNISTLKIPTPVPFFGLIHIIF